MNGVYIAADNECVCEDGYDFCTSDPQDFDCCPVGGTGGPSNEDDGTCPESDVLGRCDGDVLTYCEDGERETRNCAVDGLACGWDDYLGWYDCRDDMGSVPDPSDADGCAGLPPGGWCDDAATLVYCSQPTGFATAEIVRVQCASGRACVEHADRAVCELASGADCVPGESTCDGNTAVICSDGRWVTEACTGSCVTTAIGSDCAPDIPFSTYSYSLTYDAKGPNDGWTDWGAPVPIGAEGVLVISFHGDRAVDAQYTGFGDEAGRLSIQASASPTADDVLVAVPLAVGASGEVWVAVADPDLGPGTHDVLELGTDAAAWSWSWRITDFPSGSTVHVDQASGAGALRVYRVLLTGVLLAADRLGDVDPPSLVGWVGPSVDWSCGACFVGYPTEALGSFDSQLWIGGGTDEAYWSDAVVAHEAGHYVMFAHGEPAREGGPHSIGIPTHPGQAWSEGWATYYSSAIRASPAYYDKQAGVFFWFDLDGREYSQAVPWQRPQASEGLTQLVDENEVASMLWRIDGMRGGNIGSMLAGLASSRMTTSPFGRGYTQRVWDPPEFRSPPLPYESTRVSTPFVADFFDAILCEGLVDASQVSVVTEPSVHFPYPSATPICP